MKTNGNLIIRVNYVHMRTRWGVATYISFAEAVFVIDLNNLPVRLKTSMIYFVTSHTLLL